MDALVQVVMDHITPVFADALVLNYLEYRCP